MNRTRYLGLSLLALLCYMTAVAQTPPTVTKCEYWIDQQFGSRTTAEMTGTTWNSSIDISGLSIGLHSIAFRVVDSNNLYSSVQVRNFLKVSGTSSGGASLKTYEYWIDQDFAHKKSGTVPSGGVVNIDEDISGLSNGLHSIALRVIDADDVVSSVVVRNFLKVSGTSSGGASLKTYEYWIDQDFAHKKSGTVPSGGVVNIDEDISGLSNGLHSIALRVIDADDVVSSVVVKNFLKVAGAAGGSALQTYEYWIDQDFAHKMGGEVPTGGVINIDEDISGLSNGLHSIALRVIDASGAVSGVVVKNFLKVESAGGGNALQTYEYWIDEAFAERQSAAVPDGGVVDLNLDISALSNGIHSFNYLVRDKAGLASAPITKHFLVKKLEGGDKLVGIDYWINGGTRQRIAIDPAAANIDRDDVVIPLDGLTPSSIAADYTFDVTTKKVVTKEDITVGLQVFNDAEVGSEAVEKTIEDFAFTVDPQLVALTNEATSTKAAPKGGVVQGFSYAGAVGDSLHWEVTGSDAKLDFKDAEGNAITPETKTIAGKTVLVMKLPTTEVYLLAYGATADDDLTVKVAQPIDITVNAATREYGDANPAFSYTSTGAALLGEVAYVTTANASSPAGNYAVDIDATAITNSWVTLHSGTLTVTKAKLTVGVTDVTITQGEALPAFTLTYSGFKNGEDETVLTTQPTVTTDATSSSPAGDYVLTPGGGEAANYDFEYTNGKLTIKAAEPVTPPTPVTQDISKGGTVAQIADVPYSGEELRPAVEVRYGGKLLTEGIDYFLSYSDNVDVGTATVFISGMGDYSGDVRTTFTIVLPVNEETFPDGNLRSYIENQGSGADDILTPSELADITHLYLMGMGISNLSSIRFFGKLDYLNCRNNQLTALDLSGNPLLTELHIENNAIRGDAMTALVASLPKVKSGILKALDLSQPGSVGAALRAPADNTVVEANEMTQEQVAAARAKGWTVQALLSDGTWTDYEGSNVVGIDVLGMGDDANAKWYTLDGRPLPAKPTQKGVYIRNGRKVVVSKVQK